MTSSGFSSTGFLWRAVVVSLLLHAFLLLQSLPQVHTHEAPLIAVLRAETKMQHAETPNSAKPAPRHAKSSAVPAPLTPSESMAAAPPTSNPIASDVGEAGKSFLFTLAREIRQGRQALRGAPVRYAGTSEIRIAIASDGRADPPQLLKSSGYPELDQAALAMVGAALQRTSVPAGLLGDAFDLVLPISFDPAE